MKQKIIVDIGSGSIKAYIVDENREVKPIYKKTIMFKVNFSKEKGIREEDKNKLIDALQELRTKYKNIPVYAYATSIFRLMTESQVKELKRQIYEKTGITIDIVTKEQEALYMAKAVGNIEELDEPYLVFSIGGSSSEFIVLEKGKIKVITVVFGKPRVGKTAYMVADIVKYLNRSAEGLDLYHRCCEEIEVINEDGFRFEKPIHCPIYTNFAVNVQTGYNGFEGSYYIDGFRLGFENDNVEVLPVLPCSRIYLSEAQRYYNSRNSGVKALPDWVSRFYEEHGHFDLTIWLDMQRPGLLDLNIRELVTEFIFIEKMENKFDLMGNIL